MSDTTKMVLIALVVSTAVTCTILAVGMRTPLPLIDTAQSKAEFEENQAAAAAQLNAGT
jgi:hypothetical protein